MNMKHVLTLLSALFTLLTATGAERPQSVGLVLSGGGAKGIAHIGVIQALEDNNIPIDYITGTSMGAIVGGLYAAGYTPAEMLELIGSKGFADWSTGKVDSDNTYYLLEPVRSPAFFKINLGSDSSKITSVLPTSLINPLPMNFAFVELFTPYTAQCDKNFDNLFVPYRCVTSDVFAKHKVVLKGGNLGDAIRMSMSFPMVFQPIDLNGLPMYDGGIYDNFPVDVMMTEFAPAAVIGVDVSTPNSPDTRNMLDQLENMIMQPETYPFPEKEGVYIHIDLTEFSLLDFPKYREIYNIGYARGLEMMDSIKLKVTSRVPSLERKIRRETFKARTPEVYFDSVSVSGGKPAQNVYIKSLFRRHEKTDTFGLPFARQAYYRAITPGRLMNLVPTPHYDSSDSLFSLHLKALVKDNFSLGLGGYISSSTNSMLFLTGSYSTLSFNSLDVGLNLWIGQSYMAAQGDLRLLFPTSTPTSWTLRVQATQQKFTESEKLFFELNAPNFVTKSEVFARTAYAIASSRRSKLDLGIGYGHLTDRFYARTSDGETQPTRARGIFDLGEISATWSHQTLDNPYAPTAGSDVDASAGFIFGKYRYDSEMLSTPSESQKWFQVKVDARHFFDLSRKFSLGVSVNGILSTKKLLDSYDASVVSAPSYNPTPSTYDSFNPYLRANSFVAAGLEPVWKFTSTFQMRGSFNSFLPYRRIMMADGTDRPRWGRTFANPEMIGELAGVISLPFGSIKAYVHYTTTPGEHWNAGISIGTFMLAPKFLK